PARTAPVPAAVCLVRRLPWRQPAPDGAAGRPGRPCYDCATTRRTRPLSARKPGRLTTKYRLTSCFKLIRGDWDSVSPPPPGTLGAHSLSPNRSSPPRDRRPLGRSWVEHPHGCTTL